MAQCVCVCGLSDEGVEATSKERNMLVGVLVATSKDGENSEGRKKGKKTKNKNKRRELK